MRKKGVIVAWPTEGGFTLFRFVRFGWRWKKAAEERVDFPAGEWLDQKEQYRDKARRLRQALHKVGWRAFPILVVAHRPSYLVGKTLLPRVPRRRIASLVPFQLEQVFPVPAENLWYGHLDPIAREDGLELSILGVPQLSVRNILTLFDQAGARISGFVPSGWLWGLKMKQTVREERVLLAILNPEGMELMVLENGFRWSVWVDGKKNHKRLREAVENIRREFGIENGYFGEPVPSSTREKLIELGLNPLPLRTDQEIEILSPFLAGCLPVCPGVLTPLGRPGAVITSPPWRLPLLLLAMGLFLAVTGWAMNYRRGLALRELLEKRVESLSPRVAVIEDLENQKEGLVAYNNLLRGIIRRSPTALELLREVSEILPEDTWLTEFSYRDGQITMKGFSANSSILLGLLEGSSLFSQARYGAPITVDSRMGKEVFLITVDLGGGS